jgi:hypothetical protein
MGLIDKLLIKNQKMWLFYLKYQYLRLNHLLLIKNNNPKLILHLILKTFPLNHIK